MATPFVCPAAEQSKPLAELHDFVSHTDEGGVPRGWSSWSPRQEISPRFGVRADGGRSPGGALEIHTVDAADFGAWRTRITGVTGGKTYLFTAWYRTRNVLYERRSVGVRLEWRDGRGKAVRRPEYALDTESDGGWTRVRYIVPAPKRAEQLEVQLSLGFTADATVWWDDIQLREEPSPPDRIVRALTVRLRPRNSPSPAASVEAFRRLVEESARLKPDIVCLPEGITGIGTGKTYAEVSEAIPGPTTKHLGRLAKKLNSYVVAGIYEREKGIVYNTAVLLDRQGRLTGAYRKTHLPREEWEKGVTPGNSYPVFKTDFGTVGIIICWDVQFPEPARAMAVKGAELILLPIWGGNEVLTRARAIENQVFLVSSTYDMRSFILDRKGEVLAEATDDSPVAIAELHLDRKDYLPWLGNMKTRTWRERRPDLPVD